MPLRLGPLVLFRAAITDAAYGELTAAVLDAVVPLPELLLRRGIDRGRLPPGEAPAIERETGRDQSEAARRLQRRLDDVRPGAALRTLHGWLRVVLSAYRGTLEAYAAGCEAIERADAAAYRTRNQRGRELDDETVAALAAALREIDAIDAAVAVPETARRVVEHADGYRRLIGGAFAFWE